MVHICHFMWLMPAFAMVQVYFWGWGTYEVHSSTHTCARVMMMMKMASRS